MSFASPGLIEPLLRHLQGLDCQTPEPVRAEAIPVAPRGEYVMAAAETGTGKTAVFAQPLLQRFVRHSPAVSSNRAHVRACA
ncbi:DEAD/DEAH box helicase [Burkholderia cepacia]|uniref:DEAD/DEAH box helicase n=1 Tax=Burkholderia cepacia TaxID=292 RepID=UPI001CE3B5EA|nr:DEAD/DEAH box helicase family protein [Burkholderia cepacia]